MPTKQKDTTVKPFETTSHATIATFLMARQTRGKTTLVRVRRERADERGEPFPIVNLETHKLGVARFIHQDVHPLPPTATSAAALHKFLFGKLQELAGRGDAHIVIDSNGEDERLLALCRDYPVAKLCRVMGIEPQLFFIGGADAEDLQFLKAVDATKSFLDATTILAFAQHSSSDPDPLAAYDAFAEQPLIKAISARSGRNRKVRIPVCNELETVQDVLTPLHVIGEIGRYPEGMRHIDPWVRHRIGTFCGQLDEALAPIAGLIP